MNRIVALHGGDASVVVELRDGRAPVWRWWGPRVDPAGVPPLAQSRPAASFSPDVDQPMEVAPGFGMGWFGPAALLAHRGGRSFAHAFTLASVEEGSNELTFHLEDASAGLRLTQQMRTDPDSGATTFAASLANIGDTPLDLGWLASATLPLPPDCIELRSFAGRHNGEFVPAIEPMPAHAWLRERRRGLTGHAGPPGLFVGGPGATWHAGRVHAAQLAWSGNHRLEVTTLEDGGWALQLGAWLAPGEVRLAPGETYRAPEVLAIAGRAGLNGAMQAMHAAVRARGPAAAQASARPVHLNSWEGFYFDHDEGRMRVLAGRAAALGVERFVLDDGWFKGRSGEQASLGDWTPDPVKYPDGLGPLARHVTGLGMQFGLWVEPEMVSPDSDLYRAHPEWALQRAGGPIVTSRHQLVLDLGRVEVREHLFTVLDKLLTDAPVAYLKWDHNRDLAPAIGADGRAGYIAQVEGVYALLDRLRVAHPGLEIEIVAGGGGRIDAASAIRAERFWTSDTIDAVSRVGMQRGYLLFMPPERMGAHVGASPNHATGRAQAIAFRAAVALPGHLGLELDPASLDEADLATLTEWIERYKALRGRLHSGRTWLGDGPDGLVWEAQGEPDDLILLVYRTRPAAFARPAPLPLPPLRDAGQIRARLLATASDLPARDTPLFATMRAGGATFPGTWLAEVGLPLPVLSGEDCAIFHLERV